jgi:hypothetical protein
MLVFSTYAYSPVDHFDFVAVNKLCFIFNNTFESNINFTILVAELNCVGKQIYKYLLNSIDVHIVHPLRASELVLQFDVFN